MILYTSLPFYLLIFLGEVPVASSAEKSACGNCSKGDAFRCAGCPHRGTPAYEEVRYI